MQKSTKIIIAVVVIIAIIALATITILNINKGNTSKLGEVSSAEDLVKIIEKVYEGNEEVFSSLQTQTIDVTDNIMIKSFTGLENGTELEYLAVSEPLITSQAYSFVLAKVKSGVNANKIAEEMKENIDTRKWICVSAEKVYSTSSGDIVCLVMSSEEMAKPVYEKFKELAGNVGEEYTKTEEEIDLPPEMY